MYLFRRKKEFREKGGDKKKREALTEETDRWGDARSKRPYWGKNL